MYLRRSMVLVFGGLVACGGQATPAMEAPTPVDPAAAREPLAPSVSSQTVVVSGPRAGWPCGIDVVLTKVNLFKVTIEYAGPTWCLLPADVLGEGVIGCPTRMTHTGLNGGGVHETTLRYSSSNHLISVTGRGGTTTYEWEGDTPMTASNPSARHMASSYHYVEVDGGVEMQRDTPQGPEAEFLLRFEDRKLVEIDVPAFERRTAITWVGERIVQIERWAQGEAWDFKRPIYDCE